MEKEIVNKVAKSGIVTLDLEQLIPDMETALLDIKDQLFQGLMLREKDFRAFVKEHDWQQYEGKRLAVYCSADAIVPTWAYMLVSKSVFEYTTEVYFSAPEALPALVAERALSNFQAEEYTDARIVIKGCGDRDISNHAFVILSTKLLPHVKTLMFGEPCSTVPVYKKK